MTTVLLIAPYPPLHTEASAAAWSAARAAALSGMTVAVVSGPTRAGATLRTLVEPPPDFARRAEPRWSPAVAGRLTLSRTAEPPGDRLGARFRPDATRLVGLALRTAHARRPDLLIGWHLEPWGVAAAHAARLAHLPYGVVWGGADASAAARDEDLLATYRAVLGGAACVLAPGGPERAPRALGVPAERWLPDRARPVAGALPPPPGSRELEAPLPRLLARFDYAAAYAAEPAPLAAAIRALRPRPRTLEEDTPIVAALGDVHPGSGHEELIDALRRLVATGTWDFRFAMSLAGDRRSLEDALVRIGGDGGSAGDALARRTILVPTLHPALMPELLASCDVVCCLERATGEPPRRPRLAREALAAGAALLCSPEGAAASGVARHLASGRNCSIVDRPDELLALTSALRRLVVDETHRRTVQVGGRHLSSLLEGSLGEWNPVRRLADAAASRATGAGAGDRSRSGPVHAVDLRDALPERLHEALQ